MAVPAHSRAAQARAAQSRADQNRPDQYRPGPPGAGRSRSARSRHWNWLLIVPTVAPLLTPLTNRMEPALMGVPFFFWYQFACALLAIVVITVVHLATREDRHE